MLNAEVIRINTLKNITLEGFNIKLNGLSKASEDKWTKVTSDFLEKIKGALTNDGEKERVKVLQSNSTDKFNLQLPTNNTFASIHSLMQFCYEYCQYIKENSQLQVNYVVSKTDLEQTFLAYATHQRVNEQAARG